MFDSSHNIIIPSTLCRTMHITHTYVYIGHDDTVLGGIFRNRNWHKQNEWAHESHVAASALHSSRSLSLYLLLSHSFSTNNFCLYFLVLSGFSRKCFIEFASKVAKITKTCVCMWVWRTNINYWICLDVEIHRCLCISFLHNHVDHI